MRHKLGGARPGSGRPKGKLSPEKLEKKIIEEQIRQRVFKNVNRLINSQLNLAKGLSHLFKIVETGEGKNKKREHVLVTDSEEIKDVLDATDGIGGVVDEEYYYITTKDPDNKSIDSLLDRTLGKAVQKQEIAGKDGTPLIINVVHYGGDNTTV